MEPPIYQFKMMMKPFTDSIPLACEEATTWVYPAATKTPQNKIEDVVEI